MPQTREVLAINFDKFKNIIDILSPYLSMAGVSLVVIAAAAVFFILNRKTRFHDLPYAVKQIIIGVVFGMIAILATETSLPLQNGANVNVRDAAPIVAGFVFGPPAGIIAGVIGGVERFIAVNWGIGSYTQVACSVATIFAGIYAALLRHFVFMKKRPSVLIGAATGAVIEILHMFMVLLTHLKDTQQALEVIKACIIPMTLFTAAATGLSVLVVDLISSGFRHGKARKNTINQKIQLWLLIVIIIASVLSSMFIQYVEINNAKNNTDKLLYTNTQDIQADIKKYMNNGLSRTLNKVAEDYDLLIQSIKEEPDDDFWNEEHIDVYLQGLALSYEVAEIDVVDENNKIIYSSNQYNVGYDMNSSPDSAEFTCLLDGEKSYVQDLGLSPIGGYDPTKTRKLAGKALDSGGYILVGYNANQFSDNLKSIVQLLTENRHIGETGYIIITDKNWQIVSTENANDSDYYKSDNDIIDMDEALGVPVTSTKPLTMYKAVLFGEKTFCMYDRVESYYILAAITEDEVYENGKNVMYTYNMAQLLIYAVLFILVFILINTIIIKRIDNINNGLKNISSGNLDTVIDERNTKEFESLSDEINETVDSLKSYISEAEKRYDAELLLAKNIQTSALPSLFPPYPNIKDFDIYATMHTAKEIGGDFYDFYLLGETKFCFLIADVSGKGIPAAMFMMQSKTMIKNYIETGISIGEAITLANKELCNNNDAGMFVTAFICILDIKTGIINFVNAGHNPPLLYRKDGEFEYLKSKPGFVLAGIDTVKYKTQSMTLNPGDKLFLYTDGITEAIDLNENMYGEERLKTTLNNLKSGDPETTLNLIKNDLSEFVGDADQFDDITMLMVRFNGEQDKNIIKKERIFPAELDTLDEVLDFVDEQLTQIEAPMKFSSQLNVVVEEIFVNIAHYAYKNLENVERKAILVFEYDKEKKELKLTFLDEGIPFNPLQRDDPDVTLSAEDRQIGGLGIFLVKKIMDTVRYEHVNGQNVLIITKKL